MAIDPDVQVLLDQINNDVAALALRITGIEQGTETSYLLLEDGDVLLKEDGTRIVLSGAGVMVGSLANG